MPETGQSSSHSTRWTEKQNYQQVQRPETIVSRLGKKNQSVVVRGEKLQFLRTTGSMTEAHSEKCAWQTRFFRGPRLPGIFLYGRSKIWDSKGNAGEIPGGEGGDSGETANVFTVNSRSQETRQSYNIKLWERIELGRPLWNEHGRGGGGEAKGRRGQ